MEKTDVISYRITDVMLELWVRVACFCSGKRRRWKPVHPQYGGRLDHRSLSFHTLRRHERI